MQTIKTMKQFTEQSHIPAQLIRAVVRQIGGWQSFKDNAKDVAQYGANQGTCGFIYYTDTVKFTKNNKQAIFEFTKEISESFGDQNVITFVAGFGCLRGESQEDVADGLYNPRSENKTTVFNALAWFILEEVARSYDDLTESE